MLLAGHFDSCPPEVGESLIPTRPQVYYRAVKDSLGAEFISPQKVYTFSFMVGIIMPKKCKVYPLIYEDSERITRIQTAKTQAP